MSATLELISHSPGETQSIGRLLGAKAQPGDVFLLVGPLGAGKTCLTQGIAWGLGVKEHARSPTFVLVTRYKGRLTIHHVDLFRIEDAAEALDLGLDEYLNGDGVCVVEWAEKASEVFSDQCLWIEMEYGDEEPVRRLKLHTEGCRYDLIIKALAARKDMEKCC